MRIALELRRRFFSQIGAALDNSGYTLARLRFEIIMAPSAVRSLRSLPAGKRAEVRANLEAHLRHQPTKLSKSRIKRLRGMSCPQYRLRVGDVRVFYDVVQTEVQILAIVTKREAEAWLREEGIPE